MHVVESSSIKLLKDNDLQNSSSISFSFSYWVEFKHVKSFLTDLSCFNMIVLNGLHVAALFSPK